MNPTKMFKKGQPIHVEIFKEVFDTLSRYKENTRDESESFKTACSAINIRFRPDAAKPEIEKQRAVHNVRKLQLADDAVSEIKSAIDNNRNFLKSQVRPTQADLSRISELKAIAAAFPLTQEEYGVLCEQYGSKSYAVDRALQKIGEDAKLKTKPCAPIDKKLQALDEAQEICELYIHGTEPNKEYHNSYVSSKPGISFPAHDPDVVHGDTDLILENLTGLCGFNRFESLYEGGQADAITPDSYAEQVAEHLSSLKSHRERVEALKESADKIPADYKDALIQRLAKTSPGQLILDEAGVCSLDEQDEHKATQAADAQAADTQTA